MQLTDPTLVDPCLFWFWNASPTRREIDEQLDAFASAGFQGIYVHPMPQSFRPADFFGGMEIEYLSPEFFDLIEYSCAAMKRRDLAMWLYDEGGWPSGMAGGRVVQEDSSYGIWILEKRDALIRPVQLVAESNFPDLMNPAATDCFIRHTHEKYRDAVGNEFGKTVRGIFTDEPRLIGRLGTDRVPFSPLIPAAFKSDHGYELAEVIPELFRPDATRSKTHRNYRKTLSRLIAEHYYGRIRAWCEKHDLLFEGHHSGEDDFAQHGQYFGDYLQQARHYHIPGVDTIWRQIHPGQAGGNYVQLASSSSWLRGSRIAVTESFAVYGAGLTLEQMKWISAFQIVRGVNKIGVMAALLDTRGARRISTCSDISPKNPIWPDIDQWTGFVRRAARFSCRGAAQVRVGVYYRGELTPSDETDSFNQRHEALCDRIHDQLVGWVFVGLEDLSSATPCAGGIRAGMLTLSALVVHVDGTLDASEIAALEKVARAGVQIWWVQSSRGVSTLRELADARSIGDLRELDLREFAAVEVDSELSGVRVLALEDGAGWRGYLFFNQNSSSIEFTFRPVEGCAAEQLVAYELEASLMTRSTPDVMSGDGLHVKLYPGDMRAFQVDSSKRGERRIVEPNSTLSLGDGWKVGVERQFLIGEEIDIRIELSETSESKLGDWSIHQPEFSGSLTYETTLELESSQLGVLAILDLGLAYYATELWINGTSVGRRAWAPYRFDVTECLRSGRNDIRVRVTNTLANQWLSAEVRVRDARDWHNMYYDRVVPYFAESAHGGLVGPVVLRVYMAREVEPV